MNSKLLTMGGALLFAVAALADDDFTTLEEQMTGREFEQAGLDKLEADELRYLNDWLRNRDLAPVVRETPVVREAPANQGHSESQMGLREAEPERVVIESRIDGEFSGWSGRTVFRLENGQVWRQVGGETHYFKADSPEVRIEPKALGSWKLYVEGTGRSVKVTRVR